MGSISPFEIDQVAACVQWMILSDEGQASISELAGKGEALGWRNHKESVGAKQPTPKKDSFPIESKTLS